MAGCGKKVFSVSPARRFNVCGQEYDGSFFLCRDCRPAGDKKSCSSYRRCRRERRLAESAQVMDEFGPDVEYPADSPIF